MPQEPQFNSNTRDAIQFSSSNNYHHPIFISNIGQIYSIHTRCIMKGFNYVESIYLCYYLLIIYFQFQLFYNRFPLRTQD